MNNHVWLGRLLTVGAVLETAAGLGLLVDPAGAGMTLVNSPLEGSGIVIGRIGGAGLLALGIACWGARKTPSAPASLGVSWAYLTYNVLGCLTLAWTGLTLTNGRLPALGAAALHGVVGVALLGALLVRGRPPARHDGLAER
jgi:hypothetical protein